MEAPSIHHSPLTPINTSGQPAQLSTCFADLDFSLQDGGIDVAFLAQSIGLSEEPLLELLLVFVSASWNDLTRIEAGIRSGNTGQVAEAAHSIKGAALSFEFSDISAAAQSLETGARANALEGVDKAVEVIRVRLESIARSIDAEM
jgi:HPt (histidine-containing phosphotransfer) domain-containing protein